MKIPSEAWWTTKKIVCCARCQGAGVREYQELTNYHRGEYDSWLDYCTTCGGEGRVVENKYTLTLNITLPRGQIEYKTVEYSDIEKLDGRKTSDLYKVGRDD